MYKVPKFLKREGESLLFNDDGELVYYVPETYFEINVAEVMGEIVRLLGVFDYAILDNSGKTLSMKPFNFPTMFLCSPYKIEKVKDIKLTKNSENGDYRLLRFKKGDEVVKSVKVPQSVVNAEEFFRLFKSGKLPNTIPYDKLHTYFTDNIKLNGESYNINMQLFGILLDICRDPNDKSIPFRNSGIKDMTGYTSINIKEAPKTVSPFTAITSENWDEAVVNAIMNKNTKYSPLETLFMDQEK